MSADISQLMTGGTKNHAPLAWDTGARSSHGENPIDSLREADADSVTESDNDEDLGVQFKPGAASSVRENSSMLAPDVGEPSRAQSRMSPDSSPPKGNSTKGESSPPNKRLKSRLAQSSDSDSDSDAGAKARSQSSQGASRGGRGMARGVRQPIKRGMKRF